MHTLCCLQRLNFDKGVLVRTIALHFRVPVVGLLQLRDCNITCSSSWKAESIAESNASAMLRTHAAEHHAGPVTAEAIFLNREELPIRPLYYDPIHDFGRLPLPQQLHIVSVLTKEQLMH